MNEIIYNKKNLLKFFNKLLKRSFNFIKIFILNIPLVIQLKIYNRIIKWVNV